MVTQSEIDSAYAYTSGQSKELNLGGKDYSSQFTPPAKDQTRKVTAKTTIISEPVTKSIVSNAPKGVFGQPSEKYYGTSSEKYGEVTQTGQIVAESPQLWAKQYTEDKSSVKFVQDLQPKIESYNEKVKNYESLKKDYDTELKSYESNVKSNIATTSEYNALLKKQRELDAKYKEIEKTKGFNEEDIQKAVNISEAYSIEQKYTAPKIEAQKNLASQEELIRQKYYTDKGELKFSEKAKLYVPFYTSKYEKTLENYKKELDKYNAKFPEQKADINIKNVQLQSMQEIVQNSVSFAQLTKDTKINKENIGLFSRYGDILSAEQQLREKSPTMVNYADSDIIKEYTKKVSDYQQMESFKKNVLTGATVATAFMPTSIITSAGLALKASPVAARVGMGGLELLKFNAIFDTATKTLDIGATGYNIAKTKLETGELILRKPTSLSSEFNIAQEAESSNLKPILGQKWLLPAQKYVSENLPFMKSAEGKLALGLGLTILSKGKLGKGIGLGIASSSILPEEYFSNKAAYEASLKEQGLSVGERAYLTNLRGYTQLKSGLQLGLISTQSEILGERWTARYLKDNPILGVSQTAKTTLYGFVPIRESTKAAYVAGRFPLLAAGAYEGYKTAEITSQAQLKKSTHLEKGLFALGGAVSARVIGGAVTGLSASRVNIAKEGIREKGIMSFVYGTDLNEYLGDISASKYTSTMNKYFGVDVDVPVMTMGKSPKTVNVYTTTEKGTRKVYVPDFVLEAAQQSNQFYETYDTYRSDYAINTGQPVKSGQFNIIAGEIYTPTKVSTPTDIVTSSEIMSNIQVPTSINVPIRSQLRVHQSVRTRISQPITIENPVSINTNVNLPVSLSIPINTPINLPINVNQPTNVFMPVDIYSEKPTISSPINLYVPQPVNVPSPINVPEPINVPQPVNVPVPIPIPVPAKGFIPYLGGMGGFSFGSRTKQKKAYLPSFDAIFLNIRAKKGKYKKQALYSGWELRPLID